MLGDPSYCDSPDPWFTGGAWVKQQVVVPSTDSPTLKFWWRMFTYDHMKRPDGTKVDSLDVEVSEDDGKTWTTLWRGGNEADGPPGCENLQDLGWRKARVNLAEYKGKRVWLRFSNVTRLDGYYNTWTYLDEVRVDP